MSFSFILISSSIIMITSNVENACVASVGSLSFSFYPSGGDMSCARAWGENQLKDDEKGEGSSLSIHAFARLTLFSFGCNETAKHFTQAIQALLFLYMLCRAVNNDKSNQYCYIPRLSLNKTSTAIG